MAKTEETEELDYSAYAGKAATKMQTEFADWTILKLELTFGTKKEEAAFREGMRLGTALRIPFQKSPENQAFRAEAEAERATRPAPEKAPRAAKAAPEDKPAPAKRSKKAAAVVAEPEETVEETVAVAKASKPKKAARIGAKAPF